MAGGVNAAGEEEEQADWKQGWVGVGWELGSHLHCIKASSASDPRSSIAQCRSRAGRSAGDKYGSRWRSSRSSRGRNEWAEQTRKMSHQGEWGDIKAAPRKKTLSKEIYSDCVDTTHTHRGTLNNPICYSLYLSRLLFTALRRVKQHSHPSQSYTPTLARINRANAHRRATHGKKNNSSQLFLFSSPPSSYPPYPSSTSTQRPLYGRGCGPPTL